MYETLQRSGAVPPWGVTSSRKRRKGPHRFFSCGLLCRAVRMQCPEKMSGRESLSAPEGELLYLVTVNVILTCCSVLFIILLMCGCLSTPTPAAVTVTSLDNGGITPDNVGSFDVYTQRFLITNEGNTSAENIDVSIRISPTTTYCHGKTETFSVPRLPPNGRQVVQVSIAEFADLDCQYNYTYQAVTGG